MCGNFAKLRETYFLLTKFAWCVTPLHTFYCSKIFSITIHLRVFLFEFYCAHCNVLYLNKCILIKMEYISGGKYRFVRSEDKITFLWFILWYKWTEIRLYCNVLSSVRTHPYYLHFKGHIFRLWRKFLLLELWSLVWHSKFIFMKNRLFDYSKKNQFFYFF